MLEEFSKPVKALYHGIPISIPGFSFDGTLRVEAETEKAHMAIFKYTKGKGLPPEEYFSEEFKIVG